VISQRAPVFFFVIRESPRETFKCGMTFGPIGLLILAPTVRKLTFLDDDTRQRYETMKREGIADTDAAAPGDDLGGGCVGQRVRPIGFTWCHFHTAFAVSLP